MQKLVYDNYNKFITATETIKEMKNDVFGMDDDMESVRYGEHFHKNLFIQMKFFQRVKMKTITKTSKELDDVFQVKRMQVGSLLWRVDLYDDADWVRLTSWFEFVAF